MNYRVSHRTTYRYGDPVSLSLNQCCLRPRPFDCQQVFDYQLLIHPEPTAMAEYRDFFGNVHSVFSIGTPHREMTILAQSEVAVDVRDHSVEGASLPWESVRDVLADPSSPRRTLEAVPFLYASPMIRPAPIFADYARPSFPSGRPLLEALLDFTRRIKSEFTYDTRATSLATRCEDVLEKRRGVCQDFAQVQMSCLRSLGLAARYVSGYLLTRPPPGKTRLVGADASHCWVSVFAPDAGWIDIDPTNGCLVGEEHITVGWGRDYGDVTPVKGLILGGGGQTIQVAVDVERIAAPLPAAR